MIGYFPADLRRTCYSLTCYSPGCLPPCALPAACQVMETDSVRSVFAQRLVCRARELGVDGLVLGLPVQPEGSLVKADADSKHVGGHGAHVCVRVSARV